MRKKRVLCLIDSLGLGGAQRQMIGLVDLLRRQGYEADLVIYHDRVFYDQLLEALQIEVIKLPNTGSRWSKLKAVKDLIRRQKYDVVITYMTGANVIGSLLKWMGMSFQLIISDRTTKFRRSWRDDVVYAICRTADYVVPNSYSQAAFLMEHYPHLKRKIRPITNFTDLSLKPIESSEDLHPIQLLGAGRISLEKNLMRLVHAMALLKQRKVAVQLTWYGDTCRMEGSEVYKVQLMEEIARLGVQDMITLRPATRHLNDAYHACDAFCLPSLSEGFPNVICEAMSCGKPILCSNVCDNARIVNDTENGYLFSPETAESIADAIERFCALAYDARVNMGIRSRELAEQRFSPEGFVKQYVELIEQ